MALFEKRRPCSYSLEWYKEFNIGDVCGRKRIKNKKKEKNRSLGHVKNVKWLREMVTENKEREKIFGPC